MAAEEDNFDIDIYGDGEGDGDLGNGDNVDYKEDDEEEEVIFDLGQDDTNPDENVDMEQHSQPQFSAPEPIKTESPSQPTVKAENDGPAKPHQIPQKPTLLQGTKRKESSDDRHIESGATNALMISDLHWWTTEDDLRGWVNDAGAEDELRDITFNEHKVNGKSKG